MSEKLILIHGNNIYQNERLLTEMLADAPDAKFVDGEKVTEINEIFNYAESYSMFAEGEDLLVIRNLGRNRKRSLKETIAEYLESGKYKTGIIIYENGTLDKRIKLYKVLKRLGEIKESKPLQDMQLHNWIKSELKRRGIEATTEIVSRIELTLGNDQLLIENELEKLELFLREKGEKLRLSDEDLNILTQANKDAVIWDLLDALVNRQRRRFANLLEEVVETDGDVFALLSGLANQLKLLYLLCLGIDRQTLTSKLKYHPYSIQKAQPLVKGFSAQRIQKLYNKLTDLDFMIKQGKMNAKLGLLLYSLSL